jgi:hypothetical protein
VFAAGIRRSLHEGTAVARDHSTNASRPAAAAHSAGRQRIVARERRVDARGTWASSRYDGQLNAAPARGKSSRPSELERRGDCIDIIDGPRDATPPQPHQA